MAAPYDVRLSVVNNFDEMSSESSDLDSPIDDSDVDKDYAPSDIENVDRNKQVNVFFIRVACHYVAIFTSTK